MTQAPWITRVLHHVNKNCNDPRLISRVVLVLNCLEIDTILQPTVYVTDDCINITWTCIYQRITLKIGITNTLSNITICEGEGPTRTVELNINNARNELLEKMDNIKHRFMKA